MPLPLMLQIQQAVMDNDASVTEALRKAKLACSKLGLAEFGAWVDSELNGYTGPVTELPAYRKLHGTPEAYNPYHGWQPINFQSAKSAEPFSFAPVGMTVSAIELSVSGKADGAFEFPYPPTLANAIRKALNFGPLNVRLKISISAVADILHAVRNILLEWTVEMEKEGVLGNDLVFSPDDRAKSAAVTAQTVNNFHIQQVGALVQHANHSVVQGGVASTQTLAKDVLDLVDQLEKTISSGLPADLQPQAAGALTELRAAATEPAPEAGKLRLGLESLKHVMEHAAGHLVGAGALHLIAELLTRLPQ